MVAPVVGSVAVAVGALLALRYRRRKRHHARMAAIERGEIVAP